MKTSIFLILLIMPNYIFACTPHFHLSEDKNEASKSFKQHWKVGTKEIIKYMNKEYGEKRWKFYNGKNNPLFHKNHPKIEINQYFKNMQFVILYEKVGMKRWKEEALKIEFFSSYKNLSPKLKEISLPFPKHQMTWGYLNRLWLIEKHTNKSGKLEILLNSSPWEYYVDNCGGSGMVLSH